MAAANALEISGLEKSYRTGLRGKRAILRGLNLRVPQGVAYGLLGKNGAGKSTTFRILMGLSRADRGSARVFGEECGTRAAKLRIGFCPENPQFHSNLKVTEILRFHSSLARERVVTEKTRMRWLIEQFELTDYAGSRVCTLSKGTQQRLALALALLARPELLILDEPLTALDPVVRHRIMDLLREQKRAGMSMIISSHILAELEAVCDRLGVLAGGELQSELDLGEPEDASARAMDIRVPEAFEKVIRADDPDLIGIREGEAHRYEGLEFTRAQTLLKRWVAAGIPILGIDNRKRIQDEILSSFTRTDGDEAGREAPRRKRELV